MTDAALRGDASHLNHLLQNGRWTSPDTLQEALAIAVEMRNPPCVRILLEAGADPLGTIRESCEGRSSEKPETEPCEKPLLVHAVENGLDEILRHLLEFGGDAAPARKWKCGDTLLHIAARGGHASCIRILLNTVHHCTISYNDAYETPATISVTSGFYGFYDCFQLLIADGGVEQMDGEGRNLLHLAVVHGRYAMVQRLLSEGYAVDETDFEGHTPLIDAILRGHLVIVNLLVNFSEIDFPADKDRTGLMFAAQSNAVDALRVLIAAGACVNKTDKHGNTALILGIKHEEVTAILLANGAYTDTQNRTGVTALWYAAYHGGCPSLHCLLKASPNLELTGENSVFPLEVAIEKGHFPAAKCIIYAGSPFRNIIYTLKQYAPSQAINTLPGGHAFLLWVEEWVRNPRSLKYLCRNSIRGALGKNNISKKVCQLPLPKLLVHYADFIDLCQFYNHNDFNSSSTTKDTKL